MRFGAIIQARLSSQRCPGKVLKTVVEKPLLQYIIERLKQCDDIDSIVIATSTETSDNPIGSFCTNYNIPCMRGSLENVAGRFNDVLKHYPWDAFVRVNGDSPMIDQSLIKKGIDKFREDNFDIVTNVFPRSYPPGQSVEIIRSDTFRKTYPLMNKQEYFEHVTPYFYQNSQKFSIFNFHSEINYGNLHLAIDTPQDFQVFSTIVSKMKAPHWEYHLSDIFEIIKDIKRTDPEDS
ncbi:MAG: NTP transferase domain-containing protein [Methanoregula sp.]|jgi:spore coat polysaccharide biosynthesis protein SpsF (cytidylyltransferase family)|uniref:cytidylyltransferase domain-containing protein n=1 Tax=Methanoregula sp. TaxID=2052170 RepID=UPI003D123783